jgi:transposase
MSLFIGIDVSKATLDIASYPAGEHLQVDNTPGGHQQLHTWLQDQGAITQIGLEASGRYGEAVALSLVAHNYVVSYLNPKQIHAFAQVPLHRNKTDKQDALLIAQYCAIYRPERWRPRHALHRRLQQCSRRIAALQKMRQQEHNRLASGLTDPFICQQIRQLIAHFDHLIQQVQQLIDTLIQQHPHLAQQQALLTSIKGIGKRSAQLILAELDVDQFGSARQLAAFVGVTPQHFQSGTSVHKRSTISKQGNARLRAGLYMPAVVATRWNPACRALAQRLEAKHKPGKLIVVAVMRKLLHQIYGVLKSGRPFDPHFEDSA